MPAKAFEYDALKPCAKKWDASGKLLLLGFIGDTARYIKEGLQGASYDCKMALKWELVACKAEKLHATYAGNSSVFNLDGDRNSRREVRWLRKEPDLQTKAQKVL